MDDLNVQIQALLLKKEKECGKLTQLTSRITQENVLYINGIQDELKKICKSADLPIERNNLHENTRCISVYKFLLLNTNFKCLDLLAQDNANTHLVDICPLLSPYLLIEILWRLHYEDLLAEAILYLPLDLAVEIVEISRNCVDIFHFDRALRFITNLVIKAYKKLLLIQLNGDQSADLLTKVDEFAHNITELLQTYSIDFQFKDLVDNEQYFRHGIILKSILDIIVTCLKSRHELPSVSSSVEKYYKVTFGNDIPIEKCDRAIFEDRFDTLHKDMTDLLLKKIQCVDCNCYIAWVEFNDIEEPTITLQKAVGLRCFYAAEVIINDDKLKENELLLNCLNQISSKPENPTELSNLSLENLLAKAQEGDLDHMNEIINRCKTWDEAAFEEITKHKLPVNENVCLKLLDYVVYLKSDPQKESFYRKVYLHVMSQLLQLQSETFVQTIIGFILKYEGSDILENESTEACFKEFINRNPNLNLEKNYKQAILFLLKNVNKYLKLFIKVFLGYLGFKDTMLPIQDIVNLAPFLVIRNNENNYLMLAALKDILMEDQVALHPQVLDMMLKLTISYTCIMSHDVVNMVFTPYLLCNDYPQKNLTLVIQQLKQLWRGMSYSKVDFNSFFQGLTKKLSYARQNTSDFKSNNCLIISSIKDFFEIHPCRQEMRQTDKDAILKLVEPFLEPLDRCYFIDSCLNWFLSPTQDYIIRDYERRYFCAKYKIMSSDLISQQSKAELAEFGLLVEDFVRHAVIHSNNKEYVAEGISIIKGDWRFLNWHNPLRSFTQFCRITMEACQLCLEYPQDFAVCTFPLLLEFFVNFVDKFQSTRIIMISEEFGLTFVKGIKTLNDSVAGTPYATVYTNMIDQLNHALEAPVDNHFILRSLCRILQEFSQVCVTMFDEEEHRYTFSRAHSAVVSKFRLAYYIVNASMMITNSDINDCLLQAHQCLSN